MKVWGIDPDTKAITVAMLRAADPVSTATLVQSGQRAEDRIIGLLLTFRELLETMVLQGTLPEYVYVEKPMLTVNAAATVAQSQIVGGIRAYLTEFKIAHSLVDPGVWKKGLLGNGHATKDEIRLFAIRAMGMGDGLKQDAYDAACIARWGQNNLEGKTNA